MSLRSVKNIAAVCGGEIVTGNPDTEIKKIVSNHSDVVPGCGFVAIKGKRRDGNEFVLEAVRNGCALVITEAPSEKNIGAAVIKVKNIYTAIERLAVFFRESEIDDLVGVTGSVGKTTVRELISSVLSQKEKVLSTRDNRNNLLGLCLTLLENDGARTAVCELGISEKGEMSALSRVCAPDIAVITNVGSMHALTLGGASETAKEKMKITEHMRYGGALVVNADDPFLSPIASERYNVKTVSVLGDETADYRLTEKRLADNGTVFDVKTGDGRVFSGLFVPLYGKGGVYDAVIAVAVSDLLGSTEEEIRKGLALYSPCGNRQNFKRIGGVTVMLDCYNSGPESLFEAFEVFESVCALEGRRDKILLLGSMLELGEKSEEYHLIAGKRAADIAPKLLITYGSEAEDIAKGAIMSGMKSENVYSFYEGEEETLGKLLSGAICEKNAVLIKGSRKLKLERFEKYIELRKKYEGDTEK